MTGFWLGRSIDVTCVVDIEMTPDSFHAHAVPEGIEINPGDIVVIHNPPTGLSFGDRLTCVCRATVTRAGWLRRAWTRAAGMFELTELYEVGFAPEEAS